MERVYSDPGYSAKDFDRPQIKRLMEDLRRGAVDTVVTYKIDRVALKPLHVGK